jgi:hypothetical protein
MTILQLLLGGASDRFPVDDIVLAAFNSEIDPTDADALVRLTSGGIIETVENGSVTNIGDWIDPKVNMALYEVRVTPTSGTLSSGNVNVWEALTSTRSWGVVQAAVGSKVFTGTVEVRRASDSVVVATTTMSLTATVEV